MADMINLGLVGFFAVGGHVSALATKCAGLSIPLGVLTTSVVAAGAGILMALITARLRGNDQQLRRGPGRRGRRVLPRVHALHHGVAARTRARPDPHAVREFLTGASLIVVLRWRPNGLIPEPLARVEAS